MLSFRPTGVFSPPGTFIYRAQQFLVYPFASLVERSISHVRPEPFIPLVCSTSCDPRDTDAFGKLIILDTSATGGGVDGVRLAPLGSLSIAAATSVVRVHWHARINQLLLGCSGKGCGVLVRQ
jgi:hypothetical protein